MKKLLIGLLVLAVLVVPLSFGQNMGWQMTKDFEATYHQSSLSVWNAVLKSLVQMKYQIKVADRDSGMISAQKKLGVMASLSGYAKYETPQWDIIIQNDSEGVHVLCQHTLYAGQLNIGKASQKQFKKLATKIAENLGK